MTNEQKIFFPFVNFDTFYEALDNISKVLFEKYDLSVAINKSAAHDAYNFWCEEVISASRQLSLSQTDTDNGEKRDAVPSQLKKAGALSSCLNRTKPISRILPILKTEYVEESKFKQQIVKVYYQEWLAFEMAHTMFLVADEERRNMKRFSEFLKELKLEENEIFTHEYINDICFYLRSKAPSSTSMYMVYKSLYATSYTWRKR